MIATAETAMKQSEREIMLEQLVEAIKRDLEGLDQRIVDYKEVLKSADIIRVITGCCDARVGVSPDIQLEMQKDGRSLKVAYLYLPIIGGGLPEDSTFDALLIYLKDLGIVVRDKVEIITTHHGSQTEVELTLKHEFAAAADPKIIGCGMRSLKGTHRYAFHALSNALDEHNQQGRISSVMEIFDGLMALVESTSIPARLLAWAAKNCRGSQLWDATHHNARAITDKNFGVRTARSGYYCNETKEVHIIDRFMNEEQVLTLGLQEWHESYQDPSLIVASFGPLAVTLHNGIVFPSLIGKELGNDFSTSAAQTGDQLLTALAEGWYAANSSAAAQEGKGHGQNFASVKGCVILCSNGQYVERARALLQSKEFVKEMREPYSQFGSIILVNLENQEVVTQKI